MALRADALGNVDVVRTPAHMSPRLAAMARGVCKRCGTATQLVCLIVFVGTLLAVGSAVVLGGAYVAVVSLGR